MAASSSTSSSAAKRYDVFVSFRGEDTGPNFTSHLYSALSGNSITAYIDYEPNKGDQISPALIQAIQDSYGSLVVFSENYASSKWCLNELLRILECRKRGHFVIPVFYNIDPSHVRKQIASYGEAFAKHEQDSNNKTDMLQKWKAALTEAANIVGWHFQSRKNRDESELIQNVVEDVLQKLDCICQPSDLGLVGIDKHCEHVESLLQRFPAIGSWGIGGIGKTTIAKATFNKLSSQYDSCCFFENVREESERSGLDQLRAKLLSNLLKDEIIPINLHKAFGLNRAMRRLSSKKVFIVLDDVNSPDLLESLEQEFNFLGLGSKVIITTRDRHLLTGLRITHEIYEVKGLNLEDSLELFKLCAFNENFSEVGYEEITGKFVRYAEGTPLALKVLGSFLAFRSRDEWESTWEKLNKIPNEDIQKVLKLSFDELDHEEQQIFLDIVYFFKGEKKETVISLLNSYGFYGTIGMRILRDKSLITISDSNQVLVHDLIKRMGVEIVRRESIKNPGRRSRLHDPEEVYHVLKNDTGTDAIECIALDVSEIGGLELNANIFKRMTNLRFIKFYSSCHGESSTMYLRGDFESVPDKLRYLYWNGYPSSSLPSTFCARKLVQLRMPNSHIRKLWDGVQDLQNLKELDLHYCKQLIELPDFSMAPNLEVVLLYGCSSLCQVHTSLLCLHSLARLNLYSCTEIKSLESKIHLKSLCYLNVECCFSLKKFELSSVEMRELDLSDTTIEELKPSIGRFDKINTLYMGCAMRKLPNELSLLKSLEILSISNAEELDTWNLDIIFDGLQSLKSLGMTNCIGLCQLPDNISALSSLTKLSLNGSSVESLPRSIKHLSCLENLDISDCRMLRFLPELPPSIKLLEASHCTSMEQVITSRACWVKLVNCVRLEKDLLYTILEDFHFRMKQGLDINVCLPGNRVPMWFIYQMAHASITIELPPRSDLLGFAFCLIISGKFIPLKERQISIIGFECCLEDSETVRESSCWLADEFAEFADRGLVSSDDYMADTQLITDHVYLWYQGRHSKAILKAAENCRANEQHITSNLKLSFQFSAYDDKNRKLDNARIKECGVLPIYASKDESFASGMDVNLESGFGNKNKRRRDMDDHQQLQRKKFQ